jgi:RNA polymerase sigma factor for flagellar operon FliA
MPIESAAQKNTFTGQSFPVAAPDEKEQLILEHCAMVRAIAARLLARISGWVSQDDLYSAGIIGLIDAINKYDPATGIPFRHYAKIRVRGAMLDEIRSMDWVPRSLRQKNAALEQACTTLLQKLDRYPSADEIAQQMGVSLETCHRMLDETKGVTLLPADILELVQNEYESPSLASEKEEPFRQTHIKELGSHLAKAIRSLNKKEQLILSLYYEEELTMKEIGAVLDYTESRISQIHSGAVIKLRASLSKKISMEDLPGSLGSL